MMCGTVLSGRILRISHTFTGLHNTDHLFIELSCQGMHEYIRVDMPDKVDWLDGLQVNSLYRFSPLMEGKLHTSDGDDIPVYIADPHTGTTTASFSVEDEEQDQRDEDIKLMDDPSLISYQGKVAAVVDDYAGVYKLEEGQVLYITHLKDTTRELWSWEKRDVTDNIPFHRCLREGDEVKIDGCHKLISNDGEVSLVCCGRSHVVNMSQQLLLRPHLPAAKLPWEIRAVHTYGLSQGGIAWLLEQKAVTATLASVIPLEEHSVETILKKAVAMKLLVCEDAYQQGEQFVHHSMECHVIKNFVPPYGLITVEEVVDELRQPEKMVPCQEEGCPFQPDPTEVTGLHPTVHAPCCWSFFFGPKKLHILLGKLVVDKKKGVLKLQSNESVDVFLLNSEKQFIPTVGSIIGIYGFHLVKEEFFVQQQDVVRKCYIVCNSLSVMTVLKDNNDWTHSSSYECDVLYKGPLVSLHRKNGTEFKPLWFFNLRVDFSKLPEGAQKPKINLVRVMESNIHLFPILTSGDILQVHPGLEDVSTALSYPIYCSWARELCIEFKDSVCLQRVPFSGPSKLNYLNVTTAVSVVQSKYFIQGLVVSKHFQKPLYDSECNAVPIKAFSDQNIGTPMGKKIVLVLKDKHSEDKVFVYLSPSYYNLVSSYPLPILPGMEVQISLLIKILSQSGFPYFLGTNLTEVKAISLPLEDTNSLDVP